MKLRSLLYPFSLCLAFNSPLSLSKTLSIESIKSHFNSRPDGNYTVEDFLTYVNKEAPEYFSNYSLAYKSNSLQSADFLNPRAILFGKDANFVFTFNGHQSQKGHDEVEVSQFDRASSKFEFFTISFGPGKPVFSKPDKCLNCHGSDPKPIWRDYPNWDGIYGSGKDRIETSLTPQGSPESEYYQKFVQVAPQHSRYRFLAARIPSDECRPLASANSPYETHLNCRPNFRLATLLSYLDAQIFNRKLRSMPNYGVNKYILSLLTSGDIEGSKLHSSLAAFPGSCVSYGVSAETSTAILGKIQAYFTKAGVPLYTKFPNLATNLFFTAAGMKFTDFLFFDARAREGHHKFNWLSNHHVYMAPMNKEIIAESPDLRKNYFSYSVDDPASDNHLIFASSEAPRGRSDDSEIARTLTSLGEVGAFKGGACHRLRILTMMKIGENDFAKSL